tara:strand:+ start:137 stop:352 length:216 start_codon:yes stop_codon:yes gene_type:complete
MKNLAAQALAFQYKLILENATSLINTNNRPLDQIDKALGDMVLANQKLQLLNKIVEENNPKAIAEDSESKQ